MGEKCETNEMGKRKEESKIGVPHHRKWLGA